MGMLLIQRGQQFRVSIGGQEFLVSIEVAQSANEPASNDANGNTITFQYLTNSGTIRLDKVLDVDNRAITFEYATAGATGRFAS